MFNYERGKNQPDSVKDSNKKEKEKEKYMWECEVTNRMDKKGKEKRVLVAQKKHSL